jgi:transposase-like protein
LVSHPDGAVDGEGKVLDVSLQTKRNKAAALKLMRKLLNSSLSSAKLFASLDMGRSDVGNEHGFWRNVVIGWPGRRIIDSLRV